MVKHHDVVGRYVTIEVDDCEYKVFYLQNGKGIPLICQHTAGCHNHQWRGLLEDEEITKNYELGKETDLTFTIKSEDINKTEKLLRNNKKIKFRDILINKNLSKISIIGVGMITTPGVTYRMFQALAKKQINIQVISTSEIKISVLINKKNIKKAIAALHKEFKLEE